VAYKYTPISQIICYGIVRKIYEHSKTSGRVENEDTTGNKLYFELASSLVHHSSSGPVKLSGLAPGSEIRHRTKSLVTTTMLDRNSVRIVKVRTCVVTCVERSSWCDLGHDHGDGVAISHYLYDGQIWPAEQRYVHVITCIYIQYRTGHNSHILLAAQNTGSTRRLCTRLHETYIHYVHYSYAYLHTYNTYIRVAYV
jgi:hypothetical protein